MTNRQWLLDHHPEGPATADCWRLAESPMPEPGPGQILVKLRWLSMDPYMRGRIAKGPNYAAGVSPGQVMQGGGVGEVVASNHPKWRPGDLAEAMGMGWQDYAVLTPDAPGSARVNPVPDGVPEQATLSWLGMPGLTAWIGLTEIGRPKPGETVVISAASGAVGQVAGQIAAAMGARPVAIAGSAEKLAHCADIGYATGISHRSDALADELRAACPEGVHVFFDNTGGTIHDTVMAQLATHARVIICGRIAVVDKPADQDIGLRASSRLVVTRARVQGLIVFDWWHKRDEAMGHLARLWRDGRLKVREDVIDGLENAPEAFLQMMSGRNFGKQLVRL
ncbi:NADP-dependent oxidoreductase [Pararhodobacter sp. SW119]|uniref:NADP-dependent oxidoreductase n=1 Tax=Pararhodobacter sp. SW119 TaxID=2780075 RepID=UPI001ADEF313|nr:NADP-dependent oxidoreductase [Pararhodobacter sp. SW119]